MERPTNLDQAGAILPYRLSVLETATNQLSRTIAFDGTSDVVFTADGDLLPDSPPVRR
jgi:hypothetical protein